MNRFEELDKHVSREIMKEFEGQIITSECPFCRGKGEDCEECDGSGELDIEY
jgi:hypothetical protein